MSLVTLVSDDAVAAIATDVDWEDVARAALSLARRGGLAIELSL